jgi:hypothetical protein
MGDSTTYRLTQNFVLRRLLQITCAVGCYTQVQYATLMVQIAGESAGQFSVLNVLGDC